MFWSSNWNDKSGFHRHFQEDIFIKELCRILTISKLSANRFFFKHIRKTAYVKHRTGIIKPRIYDLKIQMNKHFYKFLRKRNPVPMYYGRVNIMQMSRVFLIKVRFYHPRKKKKNFKNLI